MSQKSIFKVQDIFTYEEIENDKDNWDKTNKWP